jgi:hypothetical protein
LFGARSGARNGAGAYTVLPERSSSKNGPLQFTGSMHHSDGSIRTKSRKRAWQQWNFRVHRGDGAAVRMSAAAAKDAPIGSDGHYLVNFHVVNALCEI